MSFDGNMLHHVTTELNQQINTGRITKIYQLSAYDLLFMIHANKEKHQLLISASPNYARIHLTKFNHERPETPPNFCMFLRKHLEGGIIQEIYQNENDRVIVFEIEKRNELGDLAVKNLIIEVTGRHANIIVTDNTFKIMEAIKHIMPFEGTSRTIYPGAVYRFPTSEKTNPYNNEQTNQFFDENKDISPRLLVDAMMGFSPIIGEEIQYRVDQDMSYKEAFHQVLNEYNPTIVASDKDYFYFTKLHCKQGKIKTFDSVNEMLDRYYINKKNIKYTKKK